MFGSSAAADAGVATEQQLSHAQQMSAELPNVTPARASEIARLVFNDRLDAAVSGILVLLVVLIVAESVLEWSRVLSGRKLPRVNEAPAIPSRFAADEIV